MGIRIYKPTSAGRRRSSVQTFDDITARGRFRGLQVRGKKHSGRDRLGVIAVRHQGGGEKKFIRLVDYKRDKFDIPARVEAIEYDPARGARLARLVYRDGERRYIIATQGLNVGAEVLSSQQTIPADLGNAMPLSCLPLGVPISNLELAPGRGARLVRGAGQFALAMGQEGKFVLVKLPSGEIRRFDGQCLAMVGSVSNPDWRHVRWGKAGRMRHRGIRPSVRGKAQNPVDHPHGGGEGHNPIGLKHPKTPWGKPAFGVKTRKAHKASNRFIVQRRK